MGYHKKEIPKGVIGEFSKIEEEFLEAKDAFEQGDTILLICELTDLIGAIEEKAKRHNLTLQDLIDFSNKTKSAFKDGTR